MNTDIKLREKRVRFRGQLRTLHFVTYRYANSATIARAYQHRAVAAKLALSLRHANERAILEETNGQI